MEFEGSKTLAIALVVSLLVGTVMGAIPGGGMIGEMLIVSLYGFRQKHCQLSQQLVQSLIHLQRC